MACKKDQIEASISRTCLIRPMQRQDVPAVLAIEQRAYDYPWTKGIFNDCLRVGYYGFVVEREEVIVGYALMNTVSDEAHVLNLCVELELRRQGIARILLEYIIDLAKELKAVSLFLEVRQSNVAALALYHDYGFDELGVRRNYYPAAVGREDAIMLVKQLDLQQM
ncbi:MAG: ribosomal protein S18-alanine N-acetyltransferase [Gammaproteobacteria bacterium]|nr:ribosomal protein S18-alanine N-acetyltransferase [Gammaproteobacteria bacterium]